jgi:hypothetical protein
MSYQDHFNTCPYCNKGLKSKPTIRAKSASSYDKRRKLIELGHLVKGVQTKAASEIIRKNPIRLGPIEKAFKLKELGKMIKGL